MKCTLFCARDAHSKLADLTIIIHDSKLWLRIQVYTQNCNRYNSESRFPSMAFPLFVNSISFLSVLFRYLHTYQTILDIPLFMYYLYILCREILSNWIFTRAFHMMYIRETHHNFSLWQMQANRSDTRWPSFYW